MGFGMMGSCCCASVVQRVVVSHLRYNYSGSDYANVACLDGATGSILWRYDFGLDATSSSYKVWKPYIGPDGGVYVGRLGRTHVGTQPFTGPDYHRFTEGLTKFNSETGAVIWDWSQERGENSSFGGSSGITTNSVLQTTAPRPCAADDNSALYLSVARLITGTDRAGVLLDPSDGTELGDVTVPSSDGSADFTLQILTHRTTYVRPDGSVIWMCSNTAHTNEDLAWLTDASGSYQTGSVGSIGSGATNLLYRGDSYFGTDDYIYAIGAGGTLPTAPVGNTFTPSSGAIASVASSTVTAGDVASSPSAATSSFLNYGAGHFSNGDVLLALGNLKNGSGTELTQIARVRQDTFPFTSPPGVRWGVVIVSSLAFPQCHVDQYDDTFFVLGSDGKCYKFSDPTMLGPGSADWTSSAIAVVSSPYMTGVYARTF